MAQHEYRSYLGAYAPNDAESAIKFAIGSMLSKIETATIVKVIAVKPQGLLAGMVDIEPLVQQIGADGQAIDHETIYNVPYTRMQGGSNAIILDPKVGDIGIAVFCHRDISNVVATKGKAKPASFRQYDLSDAIYIGGLLNGEPQQYVQFTDNGMVLKSPNQVTIDAPQVSFTGNVSINGGLVVKGVIKSLTDVVAKAISLISHRHEGVKSGTGRTGEAV